MSSDCFDVRVKSVQGTEVIFDVLTGTAGGLNDLAASRSFAVVLLHDALSRAPDSLPGPWDSAARQAAAQRLRTRNAEAELVKALAGESDWFVSQTWMQANVARFVQSAEVLERRNNLPDEELSRRAVEIEQAFGGALMTNQYHQWQPRRWEQCHNYTLRVVVTDPSWAAHLEPGVEFGTTAYDVWSEEPAAVVFDPSPTAPSPPPAPSPPLHASGSRPMPPVQTGFASKMKAASTITSASNQSASKAKSASKTKSAAKKPASKAKSASKTKSAPKKPASKAKSASKMKSAPKKPASKAKSASKMKSAPKKPASKAKSASKTKSAAKKPASKAKSKRVASGS